MESNILKRFMSCHVRNGALGPIGDWKLKDCIRVHKLLETVLLDQSAALSKYQKFPIALHVILIHAYLHHSFSWFNWRCCYWLIMFCFREVGYYLKLGGLDISNKIFGEFALSSRVPMNLYFYFFEI